MPSKNRCFISFILKSVHPRLTMLALPGGGGCFKRIIQNFKAKHVGACPVILSHAKWRQKDPDSKVSPWYMGSHLKTTQVAPKATVQRVHCHSIFRRYIVTASSKDSDTHSSLRNAALHQMIQRGAQSLLGCRRRSL